MTNIDHLKSDIDSRLKSSGKTMSDDGLEALAQLWDINSVLARRVEDAIVQMPIVVTGGTANFGNISF